MKSFLVPCFGLLCFVSCGDEGYDNVIDIDFDGQSRSFRTNGDACEFRNGSMGFSCSLDTGSNPEGADFTLTVNDDDEIEEGTYTDTIDTSNPSVSIRVWIQGPGDDAPVEYESQSSDTVDRVVTFDRLESSSTRGSFEGRVEHPDSGEERDISGTFFLSVAPL